MQTDNSKSYYAGRAAKERAIADGAISDGIRRIHLEMADHYDRLADGDSASPPRLIIV